MFAYFLRLLASGWIIVIAKVFSDERTTKGNLFKFNKRALANQMKQLYVHSGSETKKHNHKKIVGKRRRAEFVIVKQTSTVNINFGSVSKEGHMEMQISLPTSLTS